MTTIDEQFMQMALLEAEKGLYTTTPNPRVGCVFVREGQIIATGYHQKTGHAHAEAHAIAQAHKNGLSLQGSTAYVTLEPCSHQGRTGPCALALRESGVSRVVVAIQDPNPLVAGQGIALLQAAGIHVSVGVLEAQARWLNRGFLSRMERKRPWVRLKVASSADGITALPNGKSQWITGAQARKDGHVLRAQACAVLTGIGTVKADNPQLNVRGIASTRQPLKVVVDSQLEISPTATLLASGQIILAHTCRTVPAWLTKHPNGQHIEPLNLQHSIGERTHTNRIDLNLLLTTLANRTPNAINELHLEAGFGLNGSFMQAGLVDEIVQYIAPKFLGSGAGLFSMPELKALPTTNSWTLHSLTSVGEDAKIVWIRKHDHIEQE